MKLTGRAFLQDSLLERPTLVALQSLLDDVLPSWAARLAVARNDDAKRVPVATENGDLHDAVGKVAPARWGLYSAALTGAYEGLTLFIRGSRTTLPPESNMVSVEILDLASVEGRAPWEPLGALLEGLATRLSVRYACACSFEEFDSKNMVDDASGVRAVGVNLLESLPGLYWLNCFGQPHTKLIGCERLKSVRAREVREVNGGYLIRLDHQPTGWTTESYKKQESAAIEHLGPEYFFSRLDPGRATVAATFTSRP